MQDGVPGKLIAIHIAHLESLTRPGVLEAFVHRCGLRADIVTGGELRVGDAMQDPDRIHVVEAL